MGARTKKTGQSRWFIGYKKHPLRLWVSQHKTSVLLVPLVTWIAPANRGDALFLGPSVDYCAGRLNWLPRWIVGDMAYINLATQRSIRERWKVSIITRIRPDMKWVEPYDEKGVPRCRQGQPLEWLGYEEDSSQQWFGVTADNPLCVRCWDQSQCPRQFAYPAAAHEILLGRVPQCSALARHLMEKVRPWIEPAQGYEKNRLGLNQLFLNSIQLTWVMSLLADAVVLLRARAILNQPPSTEAAWDAPIQLRFEGN